MGVLQFRVSLCSSGSRSGIMSHPVVFILCTRVRRLQPPRAIAPIRTAVASAPQHRRSKVVAQQPGYHGMHECSEIPLPFEKVPVRPCIATRVRCCHSARSDSNKAAALDFTMSEGEEKRDRDSRSIVRHARIDEVESSQCNFEPV